MGHRVSIMAEEPSAAAGARTALASSVLMRRAFLLAVLVSATASSSHAEGTSMGLHRSSHTSAAATCCFVTAERPVPNNQKFRRRQHDDVALVPPPPSGGSCPYTGQLVPPSTSQLRFRSERDVGAELTSPPTIVSKNKKKRSWFKFTKRDSAPATLTVEEDEYERRKLEWAAKYTDVSTLRRSFGTNRNKLWGDFDPETTRKLYHTLLPRALMALKDLGVMTEQELAPLAYEARCAAKKYARERCVVPGRIFSMAYDGFRSWRDHGKWNSEGMTWDQVWDKYEQQITKELEDADADADELTRQICLRILERSCRTNPKVDKIFLGDEGGKKVKATKANVVKRKKQMDIANISVKLERDVHELLFEGAQKSVLFEPSKEQRCKDIFKSRRRSRRKERRRNRRAPSNSEEVEDLINPEVPTGATLHDVEEGSPSHYLSSKDVAVLRKIAEAKKKVIAVLRSERLVQIQFRQEMLKHLRQEAAKAKSEGNPQGDYRDDEGDLHIFSSDLAAPSRKLQAHGRKKVWQGRSDGVLPQRARRKLSAVQAEEPRRGES